MQCFVNLSVALQIFLLNIAYLAGSLHSLTENVQRKSVSITDAFR